MATYETPMHMPSVIWDALWKDAQVLFEMMTRWNYTSIDDGRSNAEPDAMAGAHNDLNHALTKALIELFDASMVGAITTHMYDHDTLADAVWVVLEMQAHDVTAMIREVIDAEKLWWTVYQKTGENETERQLFNEYLEMRGELWDHVFGTNVPSTDDPDEVWQPYRESIDRITRI